MNNSCNLYPRVNNGEDSILYKDLLEKSIKDRPLTNLIYASYLQPGVASRLDALGLPRNSQGEHRALDVYNFFNVASLMLERGDLSKARKLLGAEDINGNTIPIINPYDALENVTKFNKDHEGLVAALYYNGTDYYYYVGDRDSRTFPIVNNMNKLKVAWDKLRDTFNSLGVDINTLAMNDSTAKLFNVSNPTGLLNNIVNAKRIDNKYLSDALIASLFKFYPTDSGILRLKTMFSSEGSEEAIINKVIDIVKNGVASTATQRSLIDTTLNRLKQFPTLDLTQVVTDVSDAIKAENTSIIGETEKTLKDLKAKYNLEVNEIKLSGNKINTLEQAVAKGLMTLNRRYKELRRETYKTDEEWEEEDTLRDDIKEIANKIKRQKYYLGALRFLSSSKAKAEDINTLIGELNTQYATEKETAFEHAKTIKKIDDLISGYIGIVQSLTNIDNLSSSVQLASVDIDNIRDAATEVLTSFNKIKATIDTFRRATMIDVLKSILGDTLPNGQSIASIVDSMDLSKSWTEQFYSFSRASNPIIAAMGSITREAQLDRNTKLQEIETQIRRATDKLRKAGHKTDFMYEKDKMHIISDIDWNAYEAARKAYRESLESQNLDKDEINRKMALWRNKNTISIVVDKDSGREERIPNTSYRKAMPRLTQAQQDYYKEMLELKAKIETLMPTTAQDLYRPPQVRRALLDALGSGNLLDAYGGTKTKIKDIFRFTENEADNYKSGLLSTGEEFIDVEGNYKGEVKKEIPVYFVNRLNDVNELLTDFSAAIQSESSSAINYDCMNNVVDVVEFMQDYVNEQIQPAATDKETSKMESLVRRGVAVTEQLSASAKSNEVKSLMESFIDMQYYGMTLKSDSKYAPLIKKLIEYTSIKSLALNVKGAISNYLVGELQMIIEACGGEFYGKRDYIWAHGRLFGDALTKTPGKLVDFFTNNKSSYDVLLGDLFQVEQGYFREKSSKRYFNSPFRKIFGAANILANYAVGEHLIHYVNMYSYLHAQKLKLNGKDITLYDAFEKVGDENNPTLQLKAGVTDKYGNPYTMKNVEEARNTILFLNQSCHGAMADEDKSVLSQKLIGRSVLNFRQWMIETYARRYRDAHFDGVLGKSRTGYWTDYKKYVKGFFADAENYDREVALKWKDMTPAEKANVRRARGAMGIFLSLLTLSFLLGEPEDYKKNFWMRMFIYQVQRAKWDMLATDIPVIGPISTASTTISNPVAFIKTAKGFTYPVIGLLNGDLFQDQRYQGERYNKYMLNTMRYSMPFWKDIQQIQHMDTEDDIFKTYAIGNLYR